MSAQPEPVPNAPNAMLVVVLGIAGILLCLPLAPLAWKLGRGVEVAVDESGGTLRGRGLGTAGKVLGMIGTAILVAAVATTVLVATGTIERG